MGTKSEQRPSFFKLVNDTESTRLFEYGSTFPKNVKLRIKSGRKWEVKVEAIENGKFCFGMGWDTFARDVGLKFGEALLFTFDDDGSTLDVELFGTKCCESEFRASIPVIEVSDEDSDGSLCEDMNPSARAKSGWGRSPPPESVGRGKPQPPGRGRPPIKRRKPPTNFMDVESASCDPDFASYCQKYARSPSPGSVGIPAKRGRGRPPIRRRKPPLNFMESASSGDKLDDPDLVFFYQAWRHTM